MIYESVEKMVEDLRSDLTKKSLRLRKKGAKLDVEIHFIEKEEYSEQAEEVLIDLRGKRSKVEKDLSNVEFELRCVEKGLNGGSTLDAYLPELEEKMQEQFPDMGVKITKPGAY